MASELQLEHEINLIITTEEIDSGIKLVVKVEEDDGKKYKLGKVFKNKDLFEINETKEAVKLLNKYLQSEEKNNKENKIITYSTT